MACVESPKHYDRNREQEKNQINHINFFSDPSATKEENVFGVTGLVIKRGLDTLT